MGHLESLWPALVIAAIAALALGWVAAHPCMRWGQVPCYRDWTDPNEPPGLCWACIERD